MNGGLSQSARIMAQSHAAIVEQFARPTLRQITVRAVQASDARSALLRCLHEHGVEPELAERILA